MPAASVSEADDGKRFRRGAAIGQRDVDTSGSHNAAEMRAIESFILPFRRASSFARCPDTVAKSGANPKYDHAMALIGIRYGRRVRT